MYVILSYDIGVKRVRKVLAICRKYLFHTHKSVFEGNLTDAELVRLKRELVAVIDVQQDSVIVYRIPSPKLLHKAAIGLTSEPEEIV